MKDEMTMEQVRAYKAGYSKGYNDGLRNGEKKIGGFRTENEELRKLARDAYARLHGIVLENWSYTDDDLEMLEQRLREHGIEVGEE